ncbi:hypothetical protein DSLASN_27680 [Desulfoluna limicola]|uniref:Uncharacterized protein n=1 Tax=Desulfoluna limicola TaxID=2810562 RepID=A0ABM7PIL1_9BACT|nr:hypothetical protein DSLASN_27680 [Desulfoluna limicola]
MGIRNEGELLPGEVSGGLLQLFQGNWVVWRLFGWQRNKALVGDT